MRAFTFTFIPAVFAPFAVALNILAVRAILARRRGPTNIAMPPSASSGSGGNVAF